MTWQEVFEQYGVTVTDRHSLLSAGATGRSLTSAVRGGHLLRVRRDHYALPTTGKLVLEGVRVGGRLTCVSALHLADIFAFDWSKPHIHLLKNASRSRCPQGRVRPLTKLNRNGAELHWSELFDPTDGTEFAVGVRDALIQAARCQRAEHTVASLDSALHTGKIGEMGLAEVFRFLPDRLQPLHAQVDGRAESGQETVLRLIMQAAGLHVELQVTIGGVGRVDMIVEGILVLEADSRLAHDGWEMHVKDRNRDLDLAKLGYMSLRPAYQRTMLQPIDVRNSVLGLLRAWDHNLTVIA